MNWLHVQQGDAPLLISLPHTGTYLPDEYKTHFVSEWLALKDTDWHIEKLYSFAKDLDATIVRTDISRSIIDVNRDSSGVSLYPGQATTELCPTTTFDGEALYQNHTPDIAKRREAYFDPYHAALGEQIARLRAKHKTIVVYDCHSIRSLIPRLFDDLLPHFNIGTNDDQSCDEELTAMIEGVCATSGLTQVTNGRFKGGYITRYYAAPSNGVHCVQMELACRSYLPEPIGDVGDDNWPVTYDEDFAAPMRHTLKNILQTCLDFAGEHA
ncbi:MAG: N-formylglutamate deformylase [Pseudomonadota bacterium]